MIDPPVYRPLEEKGDTVGPAWRCSTCGIDWPPKQEFKTCLQCDQPCWRGANLYPLSEEEAARWVAYDAFETFYEAWCEERDQSVSGPLVRTVVGDLDDDLPGSAGRSGTPPGGAPGV